MVALFAVAFLAAEGEPPGELPSWFVVVLGALLPWVFQTFICRLPSWLKPIVAYGLSGGMAIGAGFLFAGWTSFRDILVNLPWLWACLQFVYDLLVTRVVRAREAAKRRKNARP